MSSLERVVRPFADPAALSRRRIVAAKETDTTDAASTTWGALGTLAAPAKQPVGGATFKLECCDHTWDQKGAPLTEDVKVPIKDASGTDTGDYFVVRRVKQVKMADAGKSGCNDSLESFSYVAAAVKTSLDGFAAALGGDKDCNSTYKYHWS